MTSHHSSRGLALGVASIPAGTPMPFPAPAVGLFTAIIAGYNSRFGANHRIEVFDPNGSFLRTPPLLNQASRSLPQPSSVGVTGCALQSVLSFGQLMRIWK